MTDLTQIQAIEKEIQRIDSFLEILDETQKQKEISKIKENLNNAQ